MFLNKINQTKGDIKEIKGLKTKPCLTPQERDSEEEAENQETEEMSLESIMPKKPKEDTMPGTERSTMPHTALGVQRGI